MSLNQVPGHQRPRIVFHLRRSPLSPLLTQHHRLPLDSGLLRRRLHRWPPREEVLVVVAQLPSKRRMELPSDLLLPLRIAIAKLAVLPRKQTASTTTTTLTTMTSLVALIRPLLQRQRQRQRHRRPMVWPCVVPIAAQLAPHSGEDRLTEAVSATSVVCSLSAVMREVFPQV